MHHITPRSTLTMALVLAAALGIAILALFLTAPKAHAAQAIQWHDCPPPAGEPADGMQCATLPVPLDYRHPQGKKITISISRLASPSPSQKRGVLLSNPGGPGGAGLDMPRLFAATLPQEIRQAYDLIGFDPRGVGESTPITCGLSENQAMQSFPPIDQPGGFNQTAALMKNTAAACAKAGGPTMPFITTANTARDMDTIRRALGEPKISYIGYSYGSYLGTVYAQLYPSRTDRIVLDSLIDPTIVWREQFRTIGLGGEMRFTDFANFASQNNDTYHLGATSASIRTLFLELVDYFNKHPAALPGDMLPEGAKLTGGIVRRVVFGGLYSDSSFADLAATLQFAKELRDNPNTAKNANKQALLPIAPPAGFSTPIDNHTAVATSILCNDAKWPTAIRTYKQQFTHDSQAYPLFGAIGGGPWPCAFWQIGQLEQPVTITANGPSNILLLQNTRDPATPYWTGIGLRATLGQRSRMVTADQGGHGVYLFSANTCANTITTNYLAHGEFPAGDAACPAQSSTAALKAPNKSPKYNAALQELRRRIGWQ